MFHQNYSERDELIPPPHVCVEQVVRAPGDEARPSQIRIKSAVSRNISDCETNSFGAIRLDHGTVCIFVAVLIISMMLFLAWIDRY
jgi:hypothetical protein